MLALNEGSIFALVFLNHDFPSESFNLEKFAKVSDLEKFAKSAAYQKFYKTHEFP